MSQNITGNPATSSHATGSFQNAFHELIINSVSSAERHRPGLCFLLIMHLAVVFVQIDVGKMENHIIPPLNPESAVRSLYEEQDAKSGIQ